MHNHLPIEFEKIEVAGIMTERLRCGQGRPLLYLHDGGGIEFAQSFIERLATRYDVHALSHPGFGASELPSGFTTVDDLSYHYLDYFEEADLTNVAVVGASFGGWIAAEIATKVSPRMSALVLIDAYGIKVGPRDKPDVEDIFYLLPDQVREMGWHRKRPAMSADTMEGGRRIARNRETLSLFGWSPLLHNPKLHGRLRRVRAPTLVLWGASDRLAPVDYGRAYAAAIPGAEFLIVEEAGHLPHIEQPEVVSDRIAAFLAQKSA
jgi:pimeloyl-ACP methyl ester carboxylesterase